jgi:uncharacterized protein (DUF2267 family)
MAEKSEQDRERTGQEREQSEQERKPRAARLEEREKERYFAYLADLRAAGMGNVEAAEKATSAVLCVLEQHLPGGEVQRMLDALPEPLVALQRHCERKRTDPAEAFERPEFLARVANQLGLSPDDALPVARVVLLALRAQLPDGEARRVAQELSSSIRPLWSPDRYGGLALQEEMERYYSFLGELHLSGLVPDERAEEVAQVILCTLEERLTGGEAEDVLENLPVRLRQLLTRCRRTRHAPATPFGRQRFVERVAGPLGLAPAQAEAVVRAVLASARKLLPSDEALEVADQLPDELKELWEAPAPSAQPSA